MRITERNQNLLLTTIVGILTILALTDDFARAQKNVAIAPANTRPIMWQANPTQDAHEIQRAKEKAAVQSSAIATRAMVTWNHGEPQVEADGTIVTSMTVTLVHPAQSRPDRFGIGVRIAFGDTKNEIIRKITFAVQTEATGRGYTVAPKDILIMVAFEVGA